MTEDTRRQDLRDMFEKFKVKFFPIYVGSCSANNVGAVMQAINGKLLGERSLFLVPQTSLLDGDANKFRIELVINTQFEGRLARTYNNFYALEQFLRSYSQATLELEAKTFILGLHALDELRERVSDLETQVKSLTTALRRTEKRKPSYVGKVY